MQSTEIRYFLAVASSGSLSAASQQLFVAVSAISRQIQRLETRVGAQLFDRHARGMVLNDAGQIFENHVRKSMLDMEHAIAEIKGLKAVRRTSLRIACAEGMAFGLLPMLFTQFRQLHPGVSFHLRVNSAQEVTEIMRRGECDAAFQFSLHPERDVNVVASWPAPVLLALHQRHPLAQRNIQLADLLTCPMALPEAGTTVRQLFDLSCRMEGIFVEPALTCNTFSTLYAFLLATPEAITICSQFTVMYQAVEQGLVLKSLGSGQLSQRSLQIQTAIERPHSAALTLFLDFARTALNQQDERIRAAFDI